ncbi:MAG TPA: hypothetical protein VFV17_04875 [Usitatibacteraceae bacterium]|nr:hypothetical protein [Usitatibacteraceae bacterium]
MSRLHIHRRIAAAFLAGAATLSLHAGAGSFSAGIRIENEARPEQTGLAVYPGAVQQARKGSEQDGAQVEFSFGAYRLKVVGSSLRSEDAPQRVAEFYQRELGRFGKLIDCRLPQVAKERQRARKAGELSCDDIDVRRGRIVYKAGSRGDHRVVTIEPSGEGTAISLVHVELRGLD